MNSATLVLLITLLKASGTDFKQAGHNIKLAGKGIGKAGHKIVQVITHVRRHP